MAFDDVPEIIPFPFHLEEWSSYHVGLYEDDATDSVHDGVRHTIDKILQLLPNLKKSTKLLVLSADVGSAAVYIAHKVGCKVDCVCRTKKGAETTTKLAEQAEVVEKVNIVQFKYDEIPFSNVSYDFIFALDSLSKAEDKQHVIREAARMLVPEGRFVFTDYIAGLGSDDDSIARHSKLLDRHSFVLSREYARMADIADLEKVYTKDNVSTLKEHLSMSAAELKASAAKQYKKDKKTIDGLLEGIDEMEISWGMYIFQKRND